MIFIESFHHLIGFFPRKQPISHEAKKSLETSFIQRIRVNSHLCKNKKKNTALTFLVHDNVKK